MGQIESIDLIAVGAVYHKSCMATYTSKMHISGLQQNNDPHAAAFAALLYEIDTPLKSGKAFTMNYLLEQFKSNLPEDQKEASPYRSQKLQSRLVKHYGDAIVIHSQHGQRKSNVVTSSNITLRDAIHALSNLKEDLATSKMDLGNCQQTDEATTLHSAIGILRREIAAVPTPTEYPAANETGLKSSEALVPPLLSQAILCLLDTKAFQSADPDYKPSESVWRRVLSLSETSSDAITSGFSSSTPP